MASSTLRRWVARGAVSLAVVPGFVALNVAHTDAPTAPIAAPQATTSTTDARAIEASMDMVTTTTRAPAAPTTTSAAPVVPRVTTPPTTAAPRVVAASPAPAPTLQERGEQALALLDYPWQRLGYRVEFEGPMTGLLGETNSSTRVVTIFIRDNHSAQQIARTLAHELGHALDFSLTTVHEVRQYLAIRGLPHAVTDWYPCNACNDFSSPAGDFAEVFAYYLLGPGDFRSEIAGEPSAEQLAQLSAIFAPS